MYTYAQVSACSAPGLHSSRIHSPPPRLGNSLAPTRIPPVWSAHGRKMIIPLVLRSELAATTTPVKALSQRRVAKYSCPTTFAFVTSQEKLKRNRRHR
jgi:hypothetical protein